MQRVRAIGGLAMLLALVGYVAGAVEPYPGRAFSITLLMVGITLVAIGGDPA